MIGFFFLLQNLCTYHFFSIFGFQSFFSVSNSLWLLVFSFLTQFLVFSSSFFLCESISEICKFTDWCYLVSQKHINPNRHVLSQIQNRIHFNSTYPISCHWCLSIPLENLRKPVFRGVQEVTSGIKWVIYMSTINKENTRVMIYICSKLAIIAKFEHIQPNNILLLFWSLIK